MTAVLPTAPAPSFIGSATEEGREGVLVLRGDLGADAAERVRRHLDALLADGVRHVVVDAHDLRVAPSPVVGELGRTQHRLAARRGLLRVVGLHRGTFGDGI